MKHILTFVLILLSGAVCTAQSSEEIALAVSENRKEQGSSWVMNSEALEAGAEYYLDFMVDHGEPIHGIVPIPVMFELILAYAKAMGESRILAGLTIYETLSRAPKTTHSTVDAISHIFDDSPSHAMIIYHDDAVYAGWAVGYDEHSVYVVAYTAVRKR